VNCTMIGFAFDGMHNIRRAQVAQVGADQWVIRIMPSTHYSPDDGARVLTKLARDVSPRVAARIELVTDIPLQPSGKYKWVVQEWRRAASIRPTLKSLASQRLSGASC
jgi:phenylacetate-CoA ligase